MTPDPRPPAADGERALPEEIDRAVATLCRAEGALGNLSLTGRNYQRAMTAAYEARLALTTSILSRLTAAEAENTRLHERLEDKTNSIRVEITAKLAAYNDIKLLEAEARKAADAMESVAKKLPAYSPPAETLFRRAWCLRALLSEAQPKGDQ